MQYSGYVHQGKNGWEAMKQEIQKKGKVDQTVFKTGGGNFVLVITPSPVISHLNTVS
jgi:hypothetical protein